MQFQSDRATSDASFSMIFRIITGCFKEEMLTLMFTYRAYAIGIRMVLGKHNSVTRLTLLIVVHQVCFVSVCGKA
jgi:hypothetical protein